MRTMRSMLSKLISDAIEKHGEESIQVLIVLAEKMMTAEVQKSAAMFFDRLNFNEFRGFEIATEKIHHFFKTSSFEFKDGRHD